MQGLESKTNLTDSFSAKIKVSDVSEFIKSYLSFNKVLAFVSKTKNNEYTIYTDEDCQYLLDNLKKLGLKDITFILNKTKMIGVVNDTNK
jgi:hypothetical protein